MSAYPSIGAMPMAVEPTKELKSTAAQLERDQQVLLSSAEVERSSWKQWSVHNHVCTLMSMLCLVPNICRVSHSLYVPERVFPLYNKTGIAHFCKNMESLPVAPVPPKCIPRHSRGTPEALELPGCKLWFSRFVGVVFAALEFGVACPACVALRCSALPCVRFVCSGRDELIVQHCTL